VVGVVEEEAREARTIVGGLVVATAETYVLQKQLPRCRTIIRARHTLATKIVLLRNSSSHVFAKTQRIAYR